MRPARSIAGRLSRLPWRSVARTLLRLSGTLLRGAAVAASWSGHAALRHRAPIAALAVRGMWIASLVVLVRAGSVVFDVTAQLPVDQTLTSFAVGLGLCAATVALAQPRRIRWAAVALGTVHGGLALLLWSAAATV